MSRSVLVVDDEPGIIEIASAYLRRDGFTVRTATTGRRALDAVATQHPDLIVLDLMLPDISGEEVCASLRRTSLRPDPHADGEGCRGGPAPRPGARGGRLPRQAVLPARAGGAGPGDPPPHVGQRTSPRRTSSSSTRAGSRWTGRARGASRPRLLPLTATEFRLLSALCRQPRRAFSRFELLQVLQGPDVEGFERTVDVHVMRLRRKLADGGRARLRHDGLWRRIPLRRARPEPPRARPARPARRRVRRPSPRSPRSWRRCSRASGFTSASTRTWSSAPTTPRAAPLRSPETTYAETGRWSDDAADMLAHELVLTGYDFRLVAGGRVLLDTTKLDRPGLDFRRVETCRSAAPTGEVGDLELYALGPEGNMPADDELRGRPRPCAPARRRGSPRSWRSSPAWSSRAGSRARSAGWPRPRVDSRAAARRPAPRAGRERCDELSDALGHLADDLARQQRARRQLAQDLSHELRTPLMLLQSRIEAMQDGVVPFDAAGLAALHTETLRLTRLVSQIELLAESEARRLRCATRW